MAADKGFGKVSVGRRFKKKQTSTEEAKPMPLITYYKQKTSYFKPRNAIVFLKGGEII